ncbi:MAG: hypothetical protein WDW36_005329 [Sanguina aurantia]
MAAKAAQVQALVLTDDFSPPGLGFLLLECCEDLRAVEDLLAPAYVWTPAGMRYSLADCYPIAQQTADMLGMLTHLISHLLELLLRHTAPAWGEPDPRQREAVMETQRVFIATFCIPITTILTRALLVVHFTLETVGNRRRPSCVRLLHTHHLFPHCCTIMSLCTNEFHMLSAANPLYLPAQEDRLQVLLCGAMLSCTLGEYAHAAYGDVRWSPDVTEEMTNLDGGSSECRPSKREVWAQMAGVTGPIILSTVTRLLTTAAQVGTFYQHQSPMYQSLLTPSLGLESLVLLQLSQWVPQSRHCDPSPDLSCLVDAPLSLLRLTLEASAGSISPDSTTAHLTPLLNSSLYVLAHMWGVEGRVSSRFRARNGPPPAEEVSGGDGGRGGRRAVGETNRRDAHVTGHVGRDGRRRVAVGGGGTSALMPQHLPAWEHCMRVGLRSLVSAENLVCLVPALSCAAAPLAVLWGSAGLATHAPARTLLRAWKLLLRTLDMSLGASEHPQSPFRANANIAHSYPTSASGHPSLAVLKAVMHDPEFTPPRAAHAHLQLSPRRMQACRRHTLHSPRTGTVVTHHTQRHTRYHTVQQPPAASTPSAAATASAGAAASQAAAAADAAPGAAAGRAAAGRAAAHSRLAIAQLLPTGLQLVRSALSVCILSMASVDSNHMLTDLLLPTGQLIELLLDISAWPGRADCCCTDIETGPGIHLGSEDLVTWDLVGKAVSAVDACWTLALAADAGAACARSSGLSRQLHATTRRLLTLVQHRFHDGVLGDESLGGMVAMFVAETTTVGGTKDLTNFPAIMTEFVTRSGGPGGSHGSSIDNKRRQQAGGIGVHATSSVEAQAGRGSAGLGVDVLSLGDPEDARCVRGHGDLCELVASGALPALDRLTKITAMPAAICREVARVQLRVLFWMRAGLVPLCALGPGAASWRTTYGIRSQEAGKGSSIPCGQPQPPSTSALQQSTIASAIRTSDPLFAQLRDALDPPIPPATLTPASPRACGPAGGLRDSAQPWYGAYTAVQHLLSHAGISLFNSACLDCGANASDPPTVVHRKAFRRMTRTQRLEAACVQEHARLVRVGCCNLDCRVVDSKHGGGEAGSPLLRCSQCSVVAYCCRACQKAAWAEHKGLCGVVVAGRAARKDA